MKTYKRFKHKFIKSLNRIGSTKINDIGIINIGYYRGEKGQLVDAWQEIHTRRVGITIKILSGIDKNSTTSYSLPDKDIFS